MIDKPGVFDIPEADYHSDPVAVPSLSRSIAHTLITRSARHARKDHPRLNPNFKPKNKDHYDIGHAAHVLMLGKPQSDLVIIDAANYQTDAAKEQRDAAYAAGKTPLLAKMLPRLQAMVAAGRAQLECTDEDAMAFIGGKVEQTLVWREGDVWCRSLLDHLPVGGNVFYDYKSTGKSAHPEDWFRSACDHGYDMQDAMSCRGITAVLGVENPIFRFIVQETEEPFALSVCEFGGMWREMGAQKVAYAVDFWRWCTAHNKWPGYSRRPAYGFPPKWEQDRWSDLMTRKVVAAEAGEDLREQMIEFQAPLETEKTDAV